MRTALTNYQGALMGLACGDALGATTEMMWIQDIKKQYGTLRDIIGGGWLKLEAGEITDDTGMTLALAKGIIRAGDFNPIKFIGEEFINWLDSKPKDVGNITALALMSFKNQGNWMQTGKIAHKMTRGKSAGNGTLMRCLPVALAYMNHALMEFYTEQQSIMTHYDPKATEACLIYNRIAQRIMEGFDLNEAIRKEIKDTRYKHITKVDPSGRPSGYVVDTFEWVLRVLYTSDTYEEVIVRLANMGSDSDTTAAIAGGLAGLYYGLEDIPERFTSKIILKDEIMDIAAKLHALTGDEN